MRAASPNSSFPARENRSALTPRTFMLQDDIPEKP